MNKYSLYIDNNNIHCLSDGKYLDRNKTYSLIYTIDSNKDNKIYVQADKLIIKNIDYELTLENPIQLVKSDYRYLFHETFNTIKENVKYIQNNKHKGKKVIRNASIALATGIAPIVIISSLHTSLGKKNNVNSNIVQPILDEEEINTNKEIESSIEKEIENSNIVEDKKIVIKDEEETVDTLSNDNIKTLNESVIVNDNTLRASLNIENNSINPEIQEIQEKYKDYCIKAGQKWGFSPNILLGMLTQESHGKETNLMQITYSAFKDEIMDDYNYNENKWVKVVLTDTPEKYNDIDIKITKEDLNNPFTNISCAAILLNYSTTKLKTDNIFALIEYYNKGYGNFKKNMSALEANSNKKVSDVLNNPIDTEVIDYSYVCNQGDPNYVCNVMQYIPDAENGGIYFYRIENNEKKLINVNLDRTLSIDLARN